MSILPIHIYGQPVLKKKAKPVQSVDEELVTDVGNMFETMHNAHGIGLAANQVGMLKRVIVVDISGIDETKEVPPLVLINPEVVEEKGLWVMEEGCLSLPEIRDDVERAEAVRLRYRDLDFEERELVAGDLLARVILHEIDHLDGILFVDHLGSVKQKLLKGRLNKIARGEIETTYPVVFKGVPSVERQK